MKIVHTEASIGWGGQEIRILLETLEMRKLGHDVQVICDPTAQMVERAKAYGIKPYTVDLRKKSLKYIRPLAKLLQELGPDVVNTHSSNDAWLSSLAKYWMKSKPTLIRTRHVSAPVRSNLATRWMYSRAHAGTATTGDAISRHLVDDLGIDSDKVRTIPTGVDTNTFAPSISRSFGKNIGIVATLRSWKGHKYLFEALACLDDDWTLAVVGDGPQEDALKTLARELGIESRVHFHGYLSDVSQILKKIDIFCLPSYANEGVPQALLQACATQLPIVTTNVGGIPDLITHEVHGLIVETQNAAAIAAAVQRFGEDAELRARLGQAARKNVVENHGLSQMARKMEALYLQAKERN